MHKRIVQAIMQATSKHDEVLMTYKVFPKKTDGFWKLKIVFKPRYKHLIPHVKSLSMAIGYFYGEGLWTNVKGRTLTLS